MKKSESIAVQETVPTILLPPLKKVSGEKGGWTLRKVAKYLRDPGQLLVPPGLGVGIVRSKAFPHIGMLLEMHSLPVGEKTKLSSPGISFNVDRHVSTPIFLVPQIRKIRGSAPMSAHPSWEEASQRSTAVLRFARKHGINVLLVSGTRKTFSTEGVTVDPVGQRLGDDGCLENCGLISWLPLEIQESPKEIVKAYPFISFKRSVLWGRQRENDARESPVFVCDERICCGTHVTAELLHEYLEQLLAKEDRRRVQKHLDRCVPCSDMLTTLMPHVRH